MKTMVTNIFLIMPLFYVIQASTLCSTKSPKCTCAQGRSNFSCIDAGVDFIDLGVDLKALDANITGNNLINLDGNTFKLLTKVQYLYLRHNRIAKIQSTTFNNNHDLTSLDLAYNNITQLPDHLFAATRKLKYFYCFSNNLTYINHLVFKGLTHIQYIHLHDNQITRIDPSAFLSSSLLHSLYLEKNLLQTAYWEWIQNFNHSGSGKADYELYMDDNPWSCDCLMTPFVKKIKHSSWIKSNARGYGLCTDCPVEIPICHAPPSLRGKYLGTIQHTKQLICEKPEFVEINNCTAPSDCNLNFNEGMPGKVHCRASGRPVPLVKIINGADKVLTSQLEGEVLITFAYVTPNDAGKYYCVINGYDEIGTSIMFERAINVTVTSKPTSTLSIVLALLIAAIVIFGAATCMRYKGKKRPGYGSLPENNSSVHYEVTDSVMMSQVLEATFSDDEITDYDKFRTNDVTSDEKEILV